MIELRTTNARGVLCGESQPMCKWPDTLVAEARALRAQGMTIDGIAAQLDGPHRATIYRWLAGTARKPAARVVARRVRSESFDKDHLRQGENPVVEPNAPRADRDEPTD